jgi:hypothetical protein
LALLGALLLALAACGGGGSAAGTGPAVFHLVWSSPTNGGAQVPLSQTLLLHFSEALDTSTVGPGTLSVHTLAGAALSGTVQVADVGTDDTLRWVPLQALVAGTTHVCEIAASLRSADGEELAGPASFSFTTLVPQDDGRPQPDQMRASLGQMNVGRQGHSATLLGDGRVLVAGGFTVGAVPTASAEVYREDTEQFTLLSASLHQARAAHTATRLNDGRVLLAGGWSEGPAGDSRTTASAEVFDPATNTFAQVGNMTTERADAAAWLLPDGRVLVTGGSRLVGTFLQDLDTAELFDPTSNTFSPAPNPMLHTRAAHGMVAGAGGKLVLGGGSDADLRPSRCDTTTLAFQDLGMAASDHVRFGPAMASFESGGVVIAGGDVLGTVLYVSPAGYLQNTGSALNRGRSYATAVRIAPDQILVVGGLDFSNGGFIESSCDVVVEGGTGGANTYATDVRVGTGMAHHAACRLASGNFLFCGGLNEDGAQANKTAAYLFLVR